MIRSTLCDYSDAYIFVKGFIAAPNTVVNNTNKNNTNKNLYLKIVLHLLIA